MPDEETKSERLSLAITPTELTALRFVAEVQPDKYDGWSTVVRDYSITEAVTFHQRALAATAASA